MNSENIELVLSATGARSIDNSHIVQSLWGGYGKIVRLQLNGGNYSSVILKLIKLPEKGNHPRGWNTDISHQRKLKSYQVEAYWYQSYADKCNDQCVVPECLKVASHASETILILTDLDAAGFDERKSRATMQDILDCINWLASFHATFLQSDAKGLWQQGTYWHLDTRPDELETLEDLELKKAAPLIDRKLRDCRFQTLVHGDAKLANFCFRRKNANSESKCKGIRGNVAAVDFQYVGRGCGMLDLAYFVGSCLNEQDCEAFEDELLDHYFSVLRDRLLEQSSEIDIDDLMCEWRDLYHVAWADFHRFLKGWSPGHWKINSYSERVTRQVVNTLLI